MRVRLLTASLILGVLPHLISAQKREKTFPYLGERLEYKISYGWFSLGRATATIDSDLKQKNGVKYFNATLNAKTVGLLSFIKNIDDVYTSQLRASDLKPIYSEVHTTKGKEKWDQINLFNYDSMKVKVIGTSLESTKTKTWNLKMNKQTYDIMGSYMFLRDLDWDDYSVGDSVMISTLEDHKIWDFGVEFGGHEPIEFQGKTYQAHKVIVLFPVTRTFTEEKAVLFWVIVKNGVKLPVMIEANMRIGRVRCELVEFNGKYKFEL